MKMRLFKKYLVPNEQNDHNPHLFRDASISVLFSLVVVTFIVAVSGRIMLVGSDLTALVLPRVLVDYTNEDRTTQNFKELAINPVLERAAQLKANDMAEKGYFAHKSPEGLTPWHWFKEAGYDFSYAGENLAVNFSDSIDVSRAWMASQGHRQNILNKDFREIGIATAEGMYQGRKTIFVVQLFGTPAEKSESLVPTATSSNSKVATKPTVIKTSATSSPEVLSESVSSEVLAENGTNELFIAVDKKSATTSEPKVDGKKYSSWIDRLLLSPGRAMSFVFVAITIVIMIGALYVLIAEVKKHQIRKAMLLGGLLLIIFGFLYIYRFILFYPTTIQ